MTQQILKSANKAAVSVLRLSATALAIGGVDGSLQVYQVKDSKSVPVQYELIMKENGALSGEFPLCSDRVASLDWSEVTILRVWFSLSQAYVGHYLIFVNITSPAFMTESSALLASNMLKVITVCSTLVLVGLTRTNLSTNELCAGSRIVSTRNLGERSIHIIWATRRRLWPCRFISCIWDKMAVLVSQGILLLTRINDRT